MSQPGDLVAEFGFDRHRLLDEAMLRLVDWLPPAEHAASSNATVSASNPLRFMLHNTALDFWGVAHRLAERLVDLEDHAASRVASASSEHQDGVTWGDLSFTQRSIERDDDTR